MVIDRDRGRSCGRESHLLLLPPTPLSVLISPSSSSSMATNLEGLHGQHGVGAKSPPALMLDPPLVIVL